MALLLTVWLGAVVIVAVLRLPPSGLKHSELIICGSGPDSVAISSPVADSKS
jgi:hypothetical protein